MVATMKSSDDDRHVPCAATDASDDDGDNADASSHGHENENENDDEEEEGGDSHTSSATAADDEELTLSTSTTAQLQQQQLGPGAYHVFPLGSAAAALTGDGGAISGRNEEGATEVLAYGAEVAASAALAAVVDIADLPIMVTATVVDDSDDGYDEEDGGGGEDSTEQQPTGRISSVSSVLVTHATPAPSDGDGSSNSDNVEGGGGGGGEEAVLSLVDQRVVDHRMAQLEGAHRRTLRQHRTALRAGLLLLLAIAVVVAVSVPLTRSRGDASSTTEEACTRGIVELERRSPTDEGDDAETSDSSPVVGEPYEYYGMWSDVSGNTAVVGSPGTLGVGADGKVVRAGRVHVFRGRREDKTAVDDDQGDSPSSSSASAWTWEEEATLEPNDRNTPWGIAASFGFRVALSGDVMAVASFTDDSGFPGVGMVYVYRRDAESNTWREEDVLVPPPDAEEDMFGALVAVSGSTVAVTSPLHGNSRGAVYVFERSVGEDGESAVWQEQAKLEASDGVEGDEFGSSLAIDGDTIVSGAVWAQNEAGDIGGKVYVFSKDKMGNWSETSILTAPDSKDNAEFGYAVAISNGTILVSAPFDVASTENETNGAVYIYNHVGTGPSGNDTWVETAKLSASDSPSGEEFHEFGGSIAIQDDIVAIGAPAATGGGGVYIYSLAGGGWTLMNKIQYPATISLGRTIAMSETALVITDPLYNRNGMAQSGVAFAMDADMSTKETKC